MVIKEYESFDETEVLSLYMDVGWSAYEKQKEALRLGFQNSLLVLAAYEEESLVGIIRVVGDGYTIIFVQDLLVRPKFQRQGIGSALLREIMNRYGHVRQIELVTDNTRKTAAFYQSMGFWELSEMNCRGFMRVKPA